jgi:general nucleoside transport system ATP-binding protein
LSAPYAAGDLSMEQIGLLMGGIHESHSGQEARYAS